MGQLLAIYRLDGMLENTACKGTPDNLKRFVEDKTIDVTSSVVERARDQLAQRLIGDVRG